MTKKRTRLKPEARKGEILAAAIALAGTGGYMRITRDQIGQAAGVASATVQHHFSTMPAFRRALMRYAVKNECLRVVAQGLVMQDPVAMKAPEAVRLAAMSPDR